MLNAVTDISGRVGRRAGAITREVVQAALENGPAAEVRERLHRRRLNQHRDRLPVLSPALATVADGLATRGIARAPLASLGVPGAAAMIAAAQCLVSHHRDGFRAAHARGVQFLTVPPDALAEEASVYRFGLHDALLDLAEAYIGLPVAYDGASVQYTVADGRAVSTRWWHRDREDRRAIKLAVYLNDVDEDGGPFELVTLPPAAAAAEAGFLLSEERADALCGPASTGVTTATGPEGTAVFADTAAYFHRGRPARTRDRAAVFFSYFAQRPARPFFCERTGLSGPQVERLTADLSSRQREAARWAAALPLGWKLVPRAPL